MTDPTPSRPPSSDHGTELGGGTRLLTHAFAFPIRAFRASRRLLGRVLGPVALALASMLGAIVRGLERASVWITRWAGAFGPTIRRGARVVWTITKPVLIVVACLALGPAWLAWNLAITGVLAYLALIVGVFLAVPIAIVVGFLWLVVLGGRAAGPFLVRAVAPLGRALRRAGRWAVLVVAVAARWTGHVLAAAVRRVVRVIAVIARPIGRAIATIGRAITTFIHTTGHAIATIARPIGRAITTLIHTTGHAIATIARPTGHAITTLIHTTGHAIATIARPIGRAITTFIHTTGHAIAVIARPTGHAIASAFAAIGTPVVRAARRIGAAIALRSRRIAHSTGVAMARARHAASPQPAPTPPAAPTILLRPPDHDAPFQVELFHNEFLPQNGSQVDAIISVSALAPTIEDANAPIPRAEVILVDCSGSMGHPWRKLRAARAATKAAIDSLPDGTWFAIVRATNEAEVVFPEQCALVPKTPETQAAAERALNGLWPEGGTAMGRWLLLARQLFESHPEAIPHAILLTDGRNESESPDAFRAALRSVEGRFQCECRGIGTDWEVRELQAIATSTLGTVDIVANPSDLAADFRSMAEAAAAKRVDRVALRVWTPLGASIRFVRQVAPHISDLTDLPRRLDEHTVEYPTGSWTTEKRDYHLCVDLPTKPLGSEMLAARVSLVAGDRVISKSLVPAVWTDDVELATRIVPEVEHATGQTDLLHLIRAGLDARRDGDTERATQQLGAAAKLAFETGNAATLQLIGNVVDIDDAATGTVRPKATLDEVDAMALEARSTRTTRIAQTLDELATAS